MKINAASLLLAVTLSVTIGARSIDAQTWTPSTDIGHTTSFVSMFFASPSVGYAIATFPNREFKTTNGGTSWTQMTSPAYSPSDFYFITPDTGWAATGQGLILKTTNGGTSWVTQLPQVIAGEMNLEAIQFLTPSVGYAAGGVRVVKTTNGGTTWTTHSPDTVTNPTTLTVNTAKVSTRGMHFANDQVGFVVGEGGIRKTSNGGTTWKHVYDGPIFNDVYFATPQVGYAVGQQATILKTVDGGETWMRQADSIPNISPSTAFFTIQCLNALVCYSVAIEPTLNWRLYRTLNGGITWTETTKSTSGGVQSIDLHFPDSTGGYIVSYGGKVYKSDAVPSPTSLNPGFALATQSSQSTLRLSRSAQGWNLGYSLPADQVVTVSLRDLKGRPVWSSTHAGKAGENTLAIPSTYSDGVQILEFHSNNSRNTLLVSAGNSH